MGNLRRVQYFREELHYDPEPVEGTLLTFLYDIPYFPPCGVFPPFHLLNQFLALGSCGGGMSPGATWEPFSIGEQEYADLVEALKSTPLEEINSHARYAWFQPILDPTLDHIDVYMVWMIAVSQKHRERYRKELDERRSRQGAV